MKAYQATRSGNPLLRKAVREGQRTEEFEGKTYDI
jgi:hypothetical protein